MEYSIITMNGCVWCEKAKNLLTTLQLPYKETLLKTTREIENLKANGFDTLPQIFENGRHMGGFTDLLATFKERIANV